jgi:hypothetical protein
MAERAIWQRQEGETSRQYAAFCVYRDMGTERSIRKAAKAHLASPLKRASGGHQQRRYRTHPDPARYLRTVARKWLEWSRTQNWVARAQAWDDHVHELDESRRLDRELEARRVEAEENERQRRLRREEARAARTVGRQILLRVLKAIDSRELEGLPLSSILPHLQKIGSLIEVGQRLEQDEEIEKRLGVLEETLQAEARR